MPSRALALKGICPLKQQLMSEYEYWGLQR